MAVITTGNHPKHLWPGVHAFFGQFEKDKMEQWRSLFEEKTSSKNYEEIVQDIGFGLAAIKTQGGSVSYDTTTQGGIARATHVVYGLGYAVTREEIEDNQYEGKSMDRAQSLKRSMRSTKEIVLHNHFNRAFNGSYNIWDGTTLISTAHPTLAGNQSNRLTIDADLSEASLEDLAIQIMNATDERGIRIDLQPQSLHIAPANAFEATRILKSVNQNDTANNATNAIRAMGLFPKGQYVHTYLSDADAFFVKTDALKSQVFFQRRALEFTKDNDFNTENALAKSTERYSFVTAEWRGVYGSQGA